MNFGSRKLVNINESKRHAMIEIKDDPRNPAYLQGVIEAGLRSIGIEARTKIKNNDKDNYQIEVEW